jgi:glycosyltransferase involved in cell wall biosynthesis
VNRVVILQKYLAPYRVPIFNALASSPEVELTLLYYGKPEARRKWSAFPDRDFSEVQTRCLSLKAGYEKNLELPFSIFRDLARLRPEVIICAPDNGGIAAYFYAKRSGARLCIWSEAIPMTEQKTSYLKRNLRRTLYQSAENFLVPGSLAETYLRHFRPEADIYRAPNAIAEERFCIGMDELSQKFSAGRLVITFSGSLIERKGIRLLLEAFRQLLKERPALREQCLLRVMGTGPLDLSDYQDSNVEFNGFCETELYFNNFKESHIFVLPSLHDNNPLTVVEGLFSGNVMLLSEGVGNHPEAARGNGLVVPANSATELKRGLNAILTLPRMELQRLAAISLEIAPEFSVARSVDGFLAAICGARTDKTALRHGRYLNAVGDKKSKKKPIILCMIHLPPPVNGVTVMGEQVVNSQLLREGFHLEVLPLHSASSIADVGKFRPAKFLRIVYQAWELCRYCLMRRPTLVYFTLTPNGKAFYRDLLYVAIMRLFRINRLYHLHGKGISKAVTGPLAAALYNWAFRSAQVILLSPTLYEDAAQVVKRSQCHFLANGISDPWAESYKPAVGRSGPPRILFFSNLVVSKGLFVLLEALALLKERGVLFHATFAGVWESPAVEKEFGRIVQEKGLQKLIEVCGPKYGDDKRRTFAGADIMVFPSYNDAYPLVVLEAMSHGLPVVSTLEGAIPDMVLEGETGFLVPCRDPLILAERLSLLVIDLVLRERLGQAGRKRYVEYFTSEVFERNLAVIFTKCLSV